MSVIDFTVKDAICGLVDRGVPLVKACRMVGLSKREVELMASSDGDFAAELREAHEVMIARVDHTVYEGAVNGDPKMAALFYRQHRPEMMQTGNQRNSAAASPADQAVAAIAVAAVRQLMARDDGGPALAALQRPVIEAKLKDD